MVNYEKGKIYMVWFEGEDKRYYGSTTTTLTKRLNQHKTHYKNNISKCSLFSLFEKYGVENSRIELVEDFPCNNRKELEAREGYHIRNNTHINQQITGRTKKEYYQDNKDKNKDKKKESDRLYYQKNKDKCVERSFLRYNQKREEISEQSKDRYIKKRGDTKVECDICKFLLYPTSLTRHKKLIHKL
jgi:alanyl-tRNA synthetase